MADFIQRFDDNKALSGVGSALMFKTASETKYHLFVALETTPFVVGETASHDFNLTTSPFIGKVKGKTTLDNKDVEYLWHRDNLIRLEKFKGQTLDFMAVGKDFTAQQFRASYEHRPNDQADDVAKGTLTLIPISVQEPIVDCRDLLMGTVVITNAIQDEVILASATGTFSQVVEVNVAGATVTPTSNNTAVTAAYAGGKVTLTGANESTTDVAYAIVTIKATASGYADSETTIAVEVPKANAGA